MKDKMTSRYFEYEIEYQMFIRKKVRYSKAISKTKFLFLTEELPTL